MKTYLVYHNCKFTGLAILGLYLGEKSAIRAAMRKVYQLMNVNTKKVENEWTWEDEHSCVSVMEIKVADVLDIRNESPITQFFRYKDFLEQTPQEDLEKFRIQAINRKKLLDRFKKAKQ